MSKELFFSVNDLPIQVETEYQHWFSSDTISPKNANSTM